MLDGRMTDGVRIPEISKLFGMLLLSRQSSSKKLGEKRRKGIRFERGQRLLVLDLLRPTLVTGKLRLGYDYQARLLR